MQEVVDELVKGLTSKELMGKMVIILAGYEEEIDKMLKVNQGLRSRFAEKIHFEDLSLETICTAFVEKLGNHNLRDKISDDTKKVLPDLAKILKDHPSFSNYRDVETWAKNTFGTVASRVKLKSCSNIEVTPIDIKNALEDLLRMQGLSNESMTDESKTKKRILPVTPERKLAFKTSSSFSHANPSSTNTTVTTTPPQVETAKETNKSLEPTPFPKTVRAHSEEKSFFTDILPANLAALQSTLDEVNLNSEEGIGKIVDVDESSEFFQGLVRKLTVKLNISPINARELLRKWKQAQAKLKELKTEVAKKKLRAIWRCGVCGRADKPYIACYVAPFIVRYEEHPSS